jgi:transcription initiation factor TFIID TATA-box-binding protein
MAKETKKGVVKEKKKDSDKQPEKAKAKGTVSGFKVKVQNIVAFTTLGKPIPLETMLKKVENTEWQPEQFPGLVYKITNPRASALVFSQGKIVCTGTKSLEDLDAAMKKIVGRIRKAGIEMPRKYNTKVENIVASTKIKADLHLDEIALMLENSEYEPEQFPGLVYRISEPRVAFLLFTSGRIICAGAQNVESVHRALLKFKKNLESIGVKVEPEQDT